MGCLVALFTFPFITVPSIIYAITHAALFMVLLPIGYLQALLTGKPDWLRHTYLADVIAVKLNPIFLIIGIPLILYSYVWELLAWIFFVWMIIYFILRRYSGVSQKHTQITQAHRRFENIVDRMQHKNRPKGDT